MATSMPPPEVPISPISKTDLYCANYPSKCGNIGISTCAGCNLVKYCGKDCQRGHWKSHKTICKAPLSKNSWNPEWFTSGRMPSFIADTPHSTFGMNKYLWGNMPAFDHVNLQQNEGRNWSKPLDLCFAASGDLRNILVTVNNLPSTFHSPCNIVLNDFEMYVVLRNLLLLITFSAFPPAEAAEIGLHLWYSASLPSTMLIQLRKVFSEELQKISSHMADTPSTPYNTLLSTTFRLGEKAKMHCMLPRAYWTELFAMLEFKMPFPDATQTRHLITMSEERRDYRERHLLMLPPNFRASKQRFYEDGLLLPFGEARYGFAHANYTLFDPHGGGWMLNDSADPLNCWNISAVLANPNAPKSDLYGKLYFHLLPQFEAFSARLHTGDFRFTLLSTDARGIAGALQNSITKHQITNFDRIDVSNLSDRGWVGILEVLRLISPLLKPRSDNPHAALITLFLNYHVETENLLPTSGNTALTREVREAAQLVTMAPPRGPSDPNLMKLVATRDYLKDFEKMWEMYQEDGLFSMGEDIARMKRRDKGKIVASMPFKLKRGGGKEKMLEQLMLLEVSGLHGHERYLEWVRAD